MRIRLAVRSALAAPACLLALAGLASVGCEIGSRDAAGTRAASDLFALADLPEAAELLREDVVQRARSEAEQLDAAAAERLRAALTAVEGTAGAGEAALAAFAHHASGDAAREAGEWLTSPTGRRMRALEQSAQAADWDAALGGFVDELMGEPVPVERVDLLERLALATGFVESTARTRAGVERVVLRALRRVQPEGVRMSEQMLAERVDRSRRRALAEASMQHTIVYQYVYRDASDDELERYVAFAESKAGEWLVQASAAAIDALLAALEQELLAALPPDPQDARG